MKTKVKHFLYAMRNSAVKVLLGYDIETMNAILTGAVNVAQYAENSLRVSSTVIAPEITIRAKYNLKKFKTALREAMPEYAALYWPEDKSK